MHPASTAASPTCDTAGQSATPVGLAGEPVLGRGRRRDEGKRTAVVEAALRLVEEGGLGALTMERIAERAGVSKVTIYKWWRHRAEIVLDGLLEALQPGLAWPDSGHFAADLQAQVHALVGAMLSPRGAVIRTVVGAGQEDAAVLTAFTERFIKPRRADALRAFERARGRGQLREDADLEVAIDLIYGALYYRLLVQHRALTPEFADAVVNAALYGIGPAA